MLNGGGAVRSVHAERVGAYGNTCASIAGAGGMLGAVGRGAQ